MYCWLSYAAGLITEVAIRLWAARGDADGEAWTCHMAVHVFAEAGGIGGGDPTTRLVCWELGLEFDRGGFSGFLLPGSNNSHSV